MARSTIHAALFTALYLNIAPAARAADSDAQPPTQPPLPRITVIGTPAPEENYRVDAVSSLGPLGSTKLLDAPYSISILPLDLIENSQAVNFKDVSKYLPL